MTLGLLRERPTTVQAPRDVSVAPVRTSAAAEGVRVSEAELWASYAASSPVRVEPCVCGGWIVAEPDPGDAVLAHNATPRHRAWRAASAGIGSESEGRPRG